MIYKTDRLMISPLTKEDLIGNYLNWRNDTEVTKFNRHGLFPQTQKGIEDYGDSLGNDKSQIVWGIFIEHKGTSPFLDYHIGNMSLRRIDLINRSAELMVVIGEKEYWGKGVCTEAGKLVLAHGFKRLGLERIWAGTASINEGMNRVAIKLGMVHEGTFRRGTFINGCFHDINCYSILKDEA